MLDSIAAIHEFMALNPPRLCVALVFYRLHGGGTRLEPIRRLTVLEEVNDSEIPMEPLHYPVAVPVGGQQ